MELKSIAFADLRVLEQREIVIGDSGEAQVGIGPALTAEAIRGGSGEAGSVEPLCKPGLGRAID